MKKINLGCGDKILPDYINVDTAPSRKGRQPDKLADITNKEALLRAIGPESSCDEIMAIHVIEHLWQWDAERVLKIWVQFLKPGGKLVLECPNLQYAAEQIAKTGKVGTSKEDGQLTTWVLYGDPNWKDPLMCHRWGYTEASLVLLMRSAGLMEVSAKPAQFKKGPPRDIRAEGYRKNA